MASDRIDYGIDLGTTNSVIARMERGEPVVKRAFGSETAASAIAFVPPRPERRVTSRPAVKTRGSGQPNSIQVGKFAYNRLLRDRLHALKHDDEELRNVIVEFKRTMGTDHEYPTSADPPIRPTSEALSAEVLKVLRSYVTDGAVKAAVVTIPAAFTVPQQQATQRAAELAGLRQCHLLQEPVAAAMAYGLQTDQANAKWLVFDFGGGTFDAALVLVEDGVITVKDTEGDNYLGGKDLDRAIVEEIFLDEVAREHDIDGYFAAVPARKKLLRDALMKWAEDAKKALSYDDSHWVESDLGDIILANGDEIELYFELTQERLRPVAAPLFQRAIDKAKTLLSRHGLQGPDLDELILVGGPTYSPILREMLADQVHVPNTSVDPMTVVARGAALFASTISIEDHGDDGRSAVVRLDLGYEATTILPDEFVTVKCRDLADLRRFRRLEVEFERKDTGWSSGRQALGEDGALFEVKLEEGRPNVFDIVVTTPRGDRVATHPSEITILQGTKVGGSPLPNSLGVEVWDEREEYRVFQPLKGAEKGMPLPVTGTRRGLATFEQIRPGVSTDRLLIRIYEGGADMEGLPVATCPAHVMTLELTGDQANRVIPAGTLFDLTVETERTSSILKTVTLLFPSLNDEEYHLGVPSERKSCQTDWVTDELAEARKQIGRIRTLTTGDEVEIDRLETRISEAAARIGQSGADRDGQEQAVQHLKEALRTLYGRIAEMDWLEVVAQLDETWTDLRRANAEEGYDESRMEIRDTRQRLQQVKESEDVRLGRQLIHDMERQTFLLKRCEWSKQVIHWSRENFGGVIWKNTEQARIAVNEGNHSLLGAESCEELVGHAARILDLVERETPTIPKPPVPR